MDEPSPNASGQNCMYGSAFFKKTKKICTACRSAAKYILETWDEEWGVKCNSPATLYDLSLSCYSIS